MAKVSSMNKVCVNVCEKEGHEISIISYGCLKCGMSLDEIRGNLASKNAIEKAKIQNA